MDEHFQFELFNLMEENAQSKLIPERAGTFTDNMKLPIHRWFRYSAGFSAAWVEKVITQLEPQTILDPFAGSGTVCVVADKLGINSYGIDYNNQDTIRATFHNKILLADFLRKLKSI